MTKKKSSRSLEDVELAPWGAILFTDIHFHAKTFERGLLALQAVRIEAQRRGAMVIFLGDWWELRGSLPLRQLDPLLDEFALWERDNIQTIIIPGNHDQVTDDGHIHGVRVFESFRNFTVATERIIWPERKMVFVPWRQDPGEQAAMFDLPGEGWTIFAHAEVEGATTNYAHKAIGRVTLAKIKSVARACYCGHYHKRQQLGDRTWYIGSPFEQTFGEMGDPKGIAYVTEGVLEPEWIDLEGFPRHHRVTHGVPFDIGAIAKNDIVELYAPRDLVGSEEVAATRQTIPADDVRPLPLKEEEGPESAPAFALSLDQSIDVFVDQMAAEADAAGTELVDPSMTIDELRAFGRAILAELPESKATHGMSPRVEVVSVKATDFCVLAGTVNFDFDRRGLVLLKGPIGSGKTALADALTWGLYGQTSPRKAGSDSATFRGDEVINDHAKECHVSVLLRLEDGREIQIERIKKQGKGSRVTITGIDAPDGISDSQALIDHIVGLDHVLWRTCVSLGQGTVANFVTEADKSRKTLLSNAFGLNACPPAQKLVRERLKPVNVQIDKARLDLQSETRVLQTLQESDFATQVREWDERNEAAKAASASVGQQAKVTIEECDKHLAGEQHWLDSKAKHDAAIDEAMQAISATSRSGKLSEIERDFGAARAEKSGLEAQLAKLGIEHDRMEKSFNSNPAMPCPTCGQAMTNTDAEALVARRAHEMERIERGIKTFVQRMRNLEVQMQGIKSNEDRGKSGFEQQVVDSREALGKISTALATFAKLRANRDEAERRLAESRTTWAQHDKAGNPWRARQDELKAKLDASEAKITSFREQANTLMAQKTFLDFWEVAFGPKGIPVLVLRTALYELELYANRFLSEILAGRIYCQLAMLGENLTINFFEQCDDGKVRQRRYEQLSGGQRRCVELSFSPFALSEMVFNRCGVRVPLLIIDELTTHLGDDEKPLVCQVLRRLDRSTVLVIDHDSQVQGEFDTVCSIQDVQAKASA